VSASALALGNASAAYTDFMVSQWLTKYTLEPLHLVWARRRASP
jgi:hypothetical protein